MSRIIYLAIFIYLLFQSWKWVRRYLSSEGQGTTEDLGDEMVKDPNCSVYFPKSSSIRRRIKGEIHYFCSKDCVEEYLKKLHFRGE